MYFRGPEVDIISSVFPSVLCHGVIYNYSVEKTGPWCMVFGLVNIPTGAECLMFEFTLEITMPALLL